MYQVVNDESVHVLNLGIWQMLFPKLHSSYVCQVELPFSPLLMSCFTRHITELKWVPTGNSH